MSGTWKTLICLGTAERHGHLQTGRWAVNRAGEDCEILSCERIDGKGYLFEVVVRSPTEGIWGLTLSHMSRVWRLPDLPATEEEASIAWAGAVQ